MMMDYIAHESVKWEVYMLLAMFDLENEQFSPWRPIDSTDKVLTNVHVKKK